MTFTFAFGAVVVALDSLFPQEALKQLMERGRLAAREIKSVVPSVVKSDRLVAALATDDS